MQNRFDQAVDMGLGAGLMYFLDPDLGQGRRKRIGKRLGKQIDRQLHVAGDTVNSAAQRTQQRAADVLPSARVALFQSLAADEELMKRARQTLSSHSNGFPLGMALALLAAAAVGAGLMYLLDPQMGRRRRSLIDDQAFHGEYDAGEASGDTVTGLGNQVRGASEEVRQRTNDETASDRALAERVRSHLNGATSHPGSIQVTARDGRVTLRGPILAGEVDALLARIRSVPGVRSVENRLEVHKEPGWAPGLQS